MIDLKYQDYTVISCCVIGVFVLWIITESVSYLVKLIRKVISLPLRHRNEKEFIETLPPHDNIELEYEQNVHNQYAGLDPFALKDKVDVDQFSEMTDDLPALEFSDVVKYLVGNGKTYSNDTFQAFKFVEEGEVRNLCTLKWNEQKIVIGKVDDFDCWILAEDNVGIKIAHCLCIIDSQIGCVHIAALTFAVELISRNNPYETCTDALNKWIKSKEDVLSSYNGMIKKNYEIYKTTRLNNGRTKKYKSHSFKFEDRAVKLFLDQLFQPEYLEYSLEELQETKINIKFSQPAIEYVEQITRGQNDSKYWQKFRAGRITASVFKSCTRTKISNPAFSLITRICYPENNRVRAPSLDYGCKHETDAFEQFKEYAERKHENFKIWKTGIILSTDYPEFGASPDGMCECSCCGIGSVEIKCPYTLSFGGDITELLNLKENYIIKNGDKYSVKHDHQYYYQIQMQMAITNTKFCYFIIWSENCFEIIRENFNEKFWNNERIKAKYFFDKCLKPELLGHYYSSRK